MITGICLNLTYTGAGTYISYPQMFTARTIKKTDQALQAYRQRKGTLPHSLGELRNISDEGPYVQGDGSVWGAWRQPLYYQRQGSRYALVSHGQDRKPGGVGLDCDLSNSNLQPPAAELPFYQVIFHPLAQRMVLMSFLSGAIAFALTFALVRPDNLSRDGVGCLAVQLLVTLIGTLVVASIITTLHVPSGH